MIKRRIKTVKSLIKTTKIIAYNVILDIIPSMANVRKRILSVRPTITQLEAVLLVGLAIPYQEINALLWQPHHHLLLLLQETPTALKIMVIYVLIALMAIM